MSAWFEVLGWCLIALGIWATLSASRTLRRLIRLGRHEGVELDLRLRVWRSALLGPFSFVWGVFWVSYRWMHDALLWLPATYLAMLVIWNVASWFRVRSKGSRPDRLICP